MSTQAALNRWELENNIIGAANPDVDAVFKYDEVQQSAMQAQKPWLKDPRFVKR